MSQIKSLKDLIPGHHYKIPGEEYFKNFIYCETVYMMETNDVSSAEYVPNRRVYYSLKFMRTEWHPVLLFYNPSVGVITHSSCLKNIDDPLISEFEDLGGHKRYNKENIMKIQRALAEHKRCRSYLHSIPHDDVKTTGISYYTKSDDMEVIFSENQRINTVCAISPNGNHFITFYEREEGSRDFVPFRSRELSYDSVEIFFQPPFMTYYTLQEIQEKFPGYRIFCSEKHPNSVMLGITDTLGYTNYLYPH